MFTNNQFKNPTKDRSWSLDLIYGTAVTKAMRRCHRPLQGSLTQYQIYTTKRTTVQFQFNFLLEIVANSGRLSFICCRDIAGPITDL